MSIGLKVHLVIPTQAEINNLFKNLKTELPLQLDTQAIATMKTQLEQITKMEFKLANMGQFLSDLQAMTTELENQVALAKQLSETYGSNSGELTKAILELKRELLQTEKVSSKFEADVEKVRVKQELVNQGMLDKVRLEHELKAEKEKTTTLSDKELAQLKEQEASLKRLSTLLEKNQTIKEKIVHSSKMPTNSMKALERNEAGIEAIKGSITDPTLVKEMEKMLQSNTSSAQGTSKLLYRDLGKTTSELTNTIIKLNNLEKEGNEEQAKSLREQVTLLTKKEERLKAIVALPAFNNSNSDYEYQSLVGENQRKLATHQGQLTDKAIDATQYKVQEESLKRLLELQQQHYILRSKIATVKTTGEVEAIQEEMQSTQRLINQLKKVVTHKDLVAKATQQQAELDRKTGAISTEVYSHLTKLSNEYAANQRQIEKLSVNEDANKYKLQALKEVNAELEREIDAYKMISQMSEFNNFGKDVKVNRTNEANLRKELLLEEEILDKKILQRAEALELIELKKKELTQSIKILEAGRNSEYVDVERLNKVKVAVNQLNGVNTKEVRKQVTLLKDEIKRLSSDANLSRINKTSKGLHTLGLSFKNVMTYFAGGTAIHQFFNALRSGAEDVRLLNDAFTTLSMTMTKFSTKNVNELLDQTKKLSNELSGNISSVLNTVMEVANDTESIETIINKTRPSVILANIGGVSEADAVSMIQGAMRQFSEFADQTEEDAMKVANSMTSISRSLALGFQDGLQGMSSTVSNVGSMASFLGVSFDELMSMVSGTVEKTRLSFDEVSVALRAIMARTMRITDDSVDASEATFLKAEKALASIGVSIRNVKTQELRSFVDIMRDLNEVWGDLAETTRNRVAVSVTALV